MRRTAGMRVADDAIVAVCRGAVPVLPDDAEGVDDFLAGVRYHRVAPLAHVALREAAPELAARLKEDRDRALMNHLRTSALLGKLARTLDGIEWLAFKGPMLAEFAHPVPGLRFYKDLDLLVAPGQFRDTCRRLLDDGWQVLFSDDSLEAEEFPGEIALVDAHGVVLDLHWAMEVMQSVRRRFRATAEELISRRVPVTIGPAKLHGLSAPDALVHVCQHAALIGATKLGHILDADQLARQVGDWDDVVLRAADWGAGVQVAAVLGRARRLLGTLVPDGLARDLGVGPAMRQVMRGVDATWPVQGLRQDESWVRLLTRAMRPGLASTLGSGARRVGLGAWNRLRGPEAEQPRVPASREVLDAYLSRVEAMAAR
ncbi:MAG: nucleotidyltransferase family protein [Propionibacterium sp.]|nr:nucleotidyltransferase family protein [Propionibacterium sp.]